MSGSATSTTIANMALSHVKCGTIDSIDGTTKEAQTCKFWYPTALNIMLEKANWGFAERRVALAVESGVDPSDYSGYSIAYTYPNDCLVANDIYNSASHEPDGGIKFRLGTNAAKDKTYILCSEEDAYLIYIASTESFTTMKSANFQLALSYLLASLIAMQLTGDEKMRDDNMNLFWGFASEAEKKDAKEHQEDIEDFDDYIDAGK
jgi:hypothetical protein